MNSTVFLFSISFFLLIAMIVWNRSTNSILSNLGKTLDQSNRFLINEIENSTIEVENNVFKYPQYKLEEEEFKSIK